jgi:RimJ/RimL family protein N-acetyltransferase
MSAAPIQTKSLELVPHTPDDVRAQIEEMSAAQRAELSPDWLARVQVATADDPWVLGFAMVHRTTGVVIGTCGFKGPPGGDETVEIAYGVAPDHQGNGYATEAAEALVAYAFDSGEVRVVRAHTFSETNASARVLTKCGFRRIGEIIDPEDGLVWRWEKRSTRLAAGGSR